MLFLELFITVGYPSDIGNLSRSYLGYPVYAFVPFWWPLTICS